MSKVAEKLLARVAEGHLRDCHVLIHVHKGLIYSVKVFGTLDAAIKAGRRLAGKVRFNAENDDIDVWRAGDEEASWQYREDEGFPQPGAPKLRWRDSGG